MNTQAIICLAIYLGVIVMFALQKWPLALTAMVGATLMVLTGCVEPAKLLGNIATTTTVLVASMFIVANAFGKTQTVQKLSHAIAGVTKGSITKLMIGYGFLALLVNEFIGSSSATFAIVWPLLLASANQMGISPSKLAFPLGVICISANGWTPTAGAISMAEYFRGFFEAFEMTQYADYTIMNYCTVRLFPTVIVFLYSVFITPRFMPTTVPASSVSVAGAAAEQKAQLSPLHEKVSVGAFVLMIFGIAFSSKLGLPSWLVAMVCALIVVGFRVFKGNEVFHAMGLQILFLTAGGVTLANGLQGSGAADLIGQLMLSLFGTHPSGYLVGGAFFAVSALVAQFLTNSPTNQIFCPIALMTCSALGGDPFGPVFLGVSGALMATLTPFANPTASMMFDAGKYSMKDTVKIGLPLIILVGVVATFAVMTIFPLYG